MSISSFNTYIEVTVPLDGLIFDAVYGSWILSLLLFTLVTRDAPILISVSVVSVPILVYQQLVKSIMPTVVITIGIISKTCYIVI